MSDLMTVLRNTALWCLRQYAGITSPAPNRKYPLIHYLKYQIRECPEHGFVLTSTQVGAAKRKQCQTMMHTSVKTNYSGAPNTLWCKKEAKLIEELTKDDIGFEV